MSFSGSTKQLGPFGSGGSAVGIFGGEVDAAGDEVSARDFPGPNLLNTFFTESATVAKPGTITSFSVRVEDDVSFTFDLMAQTMLIFGGTTSELFDSLGNVILPSGGASVMLLPGKY